MSLDLPRTELRPDHPAADEIRQRLEHARSTRLAQLKALDETGQSAEDHLMSNQREAIQRALKEIEEAFARLGDGTYGTCLGCSKPVPPERLEILPHTPHCVTCQSRAA
ncbi:TraR/DksA family transcriptional regulator [Streptomyces viridosporus]|uniref:TraR/DksA family transcriptional regulator n=1 Tax=Streptomyces viridosporus TaxID=67581 RepID=UPI0009C160E8|nr:TraR/DksA C4-type zinc finger protein [Streptomyces viridosporus]